jgi:hypothetical protein
MVKMLKNTVFLFGVIILSAGYGGNIVVDEEIINQYENFPSDTRTVIENAVEVFSNTFYYRSCMDNNKQ